MGAKKPDMLGIIGDIVDKFGKIVGSWLLHRQADRQSEEHFHFDSIVDIFPEYIFYALVDTSLLSYSTHLPSRVVGIKTE